MHAPIHTLRKFETATAEARGRRGNAEKSINCKGAKAQRKGRKELQNF
jgi:hypothetical protein